jgi:hypothetical protein
VNTFRLIIRGFVGSCPVYCGGCPPTFQRTVLPLSSGTHKTKNSIFAAVETSNLACSGVIYLTRLFFFYLASSLLPITKQLTPRSRVLLQKLIVTQSRNFPPFMEPEVSLPYSQESVTGPYPEPDASNPHLATLFP